MTAGKIVLAVLFAIAIGAFFYFDLAQYLSLQSLKSNRDRLLAYAEDHSVAGTLYVNVAATAGATLAFLAARYLLQDWVERKFGDRLEPIQQGFARNAFSYLMTLRLIPAFPFFLVNLVSGLTRINVGTYIAATAIGILPGSFVYAYAGRQLGTINSLGEIASPPVLLAFTLLGLLALFPIIYRKLKGRQR